MALTCTPKHRWLILFVHITSIAHGMRAVQPVLMTFVELMTCAVAAANFERMKPNAQSSRCSAPTVMRHLTHEVWLRYYDLTKVSAIQASLRIHIGCCSMNIGVVHDVSRELPKAKRCPQHCSHWRGKSPSKSHRYLFHLRGPDKYVLHRT